MKYFTLVLVLLLPLILKAHENHAIPMEKNAPRFGGKVSVINEHYMSELVIGSDMTVKLYIYDKSMRSVELKDIPNTIKGQLRNKGEKAGAEFELVKSSYFFVGKLPPIKLRPFQLDFKLPLSGKTLSLTFKDLD